VIITQNVGGGLKARDSGGIRRAGVCGWSCACGLDLVLSPGACLVDMVFFWI
jgi:hypothetical protein